MTRHLYWLTASVILFASTVFAEEAPAWLQQAAARTVPDYHNKANYVVLHDESQVSIEPGGRVSEHKFHAIKVLIKEGREAAVARVLYEKDNKKIEQFRAWLISPAGKVRKYEKKESIDLAVRSDDLYNEYRRRIIPAIDDAEVGAVFGYESIVEYNSPFAQFDWSFQEGEEPVLKSRLTLQLPAGWTAQSITFNHDPIQPEVSGSTYSWELGNLPYIHPEPMSPSDENIVPRLALSFFSPTGGGAGNMRAFKSWADISQFFTELNDPQMALDEAMRQKVKELTAGCSTDLDKLRAIGRFVQDINYVSIQIGMGRFRPHSATEVFYKSYGDCKDKSNLMRTLLKAANITAYPVLIFSSDRQYVQENWPSPAQFNHEIIAVSVSANTSIGSTIQHEKLGRLLIFDPTDRYTIVGDLPQDEQGSWALLAAGSEGGLFKAPSSPPAANKLDQSVQMDLRADGSIQSRVKVEMTGQAATWGRAMWHEWKPDTYRRFIEGWISQSVTGAKIDEIKTTDDVSQGTFHLEVSFLADGYGKFMQQRIMMFSPTVVWFHAAVSLTEPERKLPIVIDSDFFTESAEIKLPEGFVVDEMPDSVKIETSFGNYGSHCVWEGQKIRYERSLTLQNAVLPPDQYHTARKFYNTILGAVQSPVVLVRK